MKGILEPFISVKISAEIEEKYFLRMKAKERTELVMKPLDTWFAGKGVPMFDANDLKCSNSKYFLIIHVNEYDVTVMSRNTGHYWYLNNSEYPKT